MPAERIYVAGHGGLVGSAVLRALARRGLANPVTRSHAELDLKDRAGVRGFFDETRPTQVILAAAKVGGILANQRFPAEFLLENLEIQNNVIDAAWRAGVGKLCFLGSGGIYPRLARPPSAESELLSGRLEAPNAGGAIAKIAGIRLCQAYRRQYGFDAIVVVPANLYGPGDNFHAEHSHVIPGLLRRFHAAKREGLAEVVVWGSGTTRREFLYVDDLADALCDLMASYSGADLVNVGAGADVSIRELAELVREVVGYRGQLRFDAAKPDGMPRQVLDVARCHELGFRAQVSLREGLERTYAWYVANEGSARR
jgi:GDP-L-fucose synthase